MNTQTQPHPTSIEYHRKRLARIVRRYERLDAAITAGDREAAFKNRVAKPTKWRMYESAAWLARYVTGQPIPHSFDEVRAVLAAVKS